MQRSTPSSHCLRARRASRPPRSSRALHRLLFGAGAALLACTSAAAPEREDAIAVGVLPGRPGCTQVVRGVTLAVQRLNAESDGTIRVALPAYSVVSAVGRDAVVTVSPTTFSPQRSGIRAWFFRGTPSDAAGARHVARHAWDTLRVAIAAVIYPNDAPGRDWAAAFTEAWTARGGTVRIRDPYLAGQTDGRVDADHVAHVDPEIVLLPGDTDDAVPCLRAPRATLLGGDGPEGRAGVREAPESRAIDGAAGRVAVAPRTPDVIGRRVVVRTVPASARPLP